ncbi:hypothetical protein FRC05_004021 [Tulasnella sp. 425]|nr:hypothetical protein FRC05_004021 [Tulasnella sp. 425]
MSSEEDLERRQARSQAVDEEYERLSTFQVDRRRIVLVQDNCKRSGGYGIVRQAHLYPSSYLPAWLALRQYGPAQHVAVKQIKISEVDNMPDAKRAFTKELLVWSGLGEHPGIAKFLGFYAKLESSEAWLLSPWEPYGNVMEFVHKRELEVPEKLSLMYDTIDALAFLHQLSPPVCHGDIKSANVLISSKCRAVLCDFGLARLYEDNGFKRLETSTGFKGSLRCPEILDGHPRTPASDVYAWAWLVWESISDSEYNTNDTRFKIMTGELPYDGTVADYAIIRRIFESPRPQVDGETRLGDCLQVWDLMTRCWALDPEQRPTASMCRTTIAYLPRCPPTPDNFDRHVRSAALLESIGDLESWKGNYTEGLSHLEQALQAYEEEGNERGVASVLRKQGVVYLRHSYPLKALSVAVRALDKYQTLDDSLGTAEVLFIMGSSLAMEYKHGEAMQFFKEAFEIFQINGNDVGVVQCLERIGEIHRREDRRTEATSTLENAVEIARRCGDSLGGAKSLLILGMLYGTQGDGERGASTLRETCNTARRIGWEHGICTCLIQLGEIKYYGGAYHEAEELYQEAVVVARRSNAWWRLAQALSGLGAAYYWQRQLDGAAAALEESCSVYHKISLSNEELGSTASSLAALKGEQGKVEEALFWYDQAITGYRRARKSDQVLWYIEKKADILVEAGRYDEAALQLEACLVLQMEQGEWSGWTSERLSRIPRTAMKWERRKQLKPVLAKIPSVSRISPIMCDLGRLQRRMPQMATANLKLPIGLRELKSS